MSQKLLDKAIAEETENFLSEFSQTRENETQEQEAPMTRHMIALLVTLSCCSAPIDADTPLTCEVTKIASERCGSTNAMVIPFPSPDVDHMTLFVADDPNKPEPVWTPVDKSLYSIRDGHAVVLDWQCGETMPLLFGVGFGCE